MIAASDIRDPSVMREELADLVNYLDGLPDDVRRSGAFTAYDQRAGELSRELVLTETSLKLKLARRDGNDLDQMSEYGRMCKSLSVLTQRYEKLAQQSLAKGRAMRWVLAAASAGSAISALTPAAPLVLPLSGAAATLAVYVVYQGERTRKQEQAAARLSALFQEITHSFGSSGQLLRPSEYYSASARRIEVLLDEVSLAMR